MGKGVDAIAIVVIVHDHTLPAATIHAAKLTYQHEYSYVHLIP